MQAWRAGDCSAQAAIAQLHVEASEATAALAALRSQLVAAQARVHELEAAAAAGGAAAESSELGTPVGKGAARDRAGQAGPKVTPVLRHKAAVRHDEQRKGVPPLLAAGRWAVSAGVAVLLGVAVGTQAAAAARRSSAAAGASALGRLRQR